MDVTIKPYIAAYAQGVAQIEKDCFSLPWSAAAIEDFSVQPQTRILVALDGEALIGYVGAYLILDTADITNLGVLASYRRQGVGGSLLRAMIALLAKDGGRHLQLEVRKSHEETILFYRRNNFVQNGMRQDFYQKPTEDAVLMTCPLDCGKEESIR